MKNKLFETGTVEKPPKKVLAKVLLQARLEIGKGEDEWDTRDTCKAIELLPDEYRAQFEGVDAVRFKNMMQRLRKDKVVPKVKPPKVFSDRAKKLLRDFEKSRQRGDNSHLSEEYIEYVVNQSEEWRKKSREHKERCNWCCQLCGAKTSKLDTHHTTEGYRNLRNEKPWHLLALCETPCHPFADMIRSGWLHNHGHEYQGFFREEDIPGN